MEGFVEPRLFRLAIEAVTFAATYDPGEGWRVGLRTRRQGESWEEGYAASYELLTTSELADVLSVELDRLFDLEGWPTST